MASIQAGSDYFTDVNVVTNSLKKYTKTLRLLGHAASDVTEKLAEALSSTSYSATAALFAKKTKSVHKTILSQLDMARLEVPIDRDSENQDKMTAEVLVRLMKFQTSLLESCAEAFEPFVTYETIEDITEVEIPVFHLESELDVGRQASSSGEVYEIMDIYNQISPNLEICNVGEHSEINRFLPDIKPENDDEVIYEIITGIGSTSKAMMPSSAQKSRDAPCNVVSRVKKKIKVELPAENHQCNICGNEFDNLERLEKHSLIHLIRKEEKPHVCDLCGRRFNLPTGLQRHLSFHTGDKPIKCELCGKVFTRLETLKSHMLIHRGERPHQCKTCEKRFTHSSTLRKHIASHAEVKPYSCQFCGRRFAQTAGLQRHLIWHTGEKLYNCEVCDKKFTRLYSLKTHQTKLHELFKCKLCDKEFNKKRSLRLHMMIHRCHQCKICQHEFGCLSDVKNHLTAHMGENDSYKCIVCEKKFCQATGLKVHLLVHTGEKPHLCSICGAQFAYQAQLQKHSVCHKS